MTVAGKKNIVLGENGAGGKITRFLIHTEGSGRAKGQRWPTRFTGHIQTACLAQLGLPAREFGDSVQYADSKKNPRGMGLTDVSLPSLVHIRKQLSDWRCSVYRPVLQIQTEITL